MRFLRTVDRDLGQTPDYSPEIVEVSVFQRGVTVCEHLAMTFVLHVSSHRFQRVESVAAFVAPKADVPDTDFLACQPYFCSFKRHRPVF